MFCANVEFVALTATIYFWLLAISFVVEQNVCSFRKCKNVMFCFY